MALISDCKRLDAEEGKNILKNYLSPKYKRNMVVIELFYEIYMTSAQVVKTPGNAVANNSPSRGCFHPNDHQTTQTTETPEFKRFTKI